MIRIPTEYAPTIAPRISEYIKNNLAKWSLDKLNGGIGNQVSEI